MKSWLAIEAELGLTAVQESAIHPHHPLEHAEWFHVRDASGCTEYEFLNLIHALVLATKPVVVLETGTFTGMGTLAIAHALSWNGFGQVTTVDIEPCAEARALIESLGLSHHVKFVQSDSLDFCSTYDGPPLDFVFVDSGPWRLKETNALYSRGCLKEECCVLVHDCSPLRDGMADSWHAIFEKECLIPGHTLKLSRGMRMMFVENQH